jgi:two-component system sensor histidine kinase TctE
VISDDGPRIPVEERERVFERFHRLLGTHAEGSGLGLAIVRDIASLHEAQIDLEEDVDGVGNTFTVTFPACGEALPGPAPQTLQHGNPAASRA